MIFTFVTVLSSVSPYVLCVNGWLLSHGLTLNVVGSLGIPAIGFFPAHHQEYSFLDTRVANNVEHAFHALALDEQRKPFAPSVWERPTDPSKLKVLKQVWFPGVHSNVGGYDTAQRLL